MKYVLNSRLFKRLLTQFGYKNVLDFARKSGIHRNTINNYLRGKNVFQQGFSEIANKLPFPHTELIQPVSDSEAGDISIEIRKAVGKLVEKFSDSAILLLGSRAKAKEKKYSDWDIGITRSSKPITSTQYLECKQIVEEICEDLVRQVDLINLDEAPLWFLEEIDYDPIYLDGDYKSYVFFKGVLNGIRKEIKRSA